MALKEDIQPSHAQMNITTRRFQYVPCYYSFFLRSLTFQISMKGGKLARLLLSIVVLEILFFTGSDAVPQVGCSSARPSFPRWVNNWQQNFGVRCHTSKKSFYQSLRLTCILFLLRLVTTSRTLNEQLMILSKFKFRFHSLCLQNKNIVNLHTNKNVPFFTETRADLSEKLKFFFQEIF